MGLFQHPWDSWRSLVQIRLEAPSTVVTLPAVLTRDHKLEDLRFEIDVGMCGGEGNEEPEHLPILCFEIPCIGYLR